jgi:hypothetical protein
MTETSAPAEVVQIKPCPLCDGEALLEDVSNFLGNSRWQVVCNNETCALNERVPTQAEAIAAWNTRPVASTLDPETVDAWAFNVMLECRGHAEAKINILLGGAILDLRDLHKILQALSPGKTGSAGVGEGTP